MEKQGLLKTRRKHYYEQAGWINRQFFWYGYHILRRGQGGDVGVDDIEPNLDENDSKKLGDELEFTLNRSKVQRSKRPLLKALCINFGWNISLQMINGYVRDGISRIVQYILLGRFIRSFRDHETLYDTVHYGILLILSLFIFAILTQRSFQSATDVALKMRIAVSSVIYRKSLRVSHRALWRLGGVGKITNLIASDIGVFDYGVQYTPQILITTLTILSMAILIWSYVGVSCLIGLGFSLLFIPLQMYTSKKFAKYRVKTAACTDYRLRLLNEVLNGILLIKMSCWESCLMERVEEARADEVKLIRRKASLNVSVNSILQITPKIALFATLITYISNGNNLDAETGFMLMALFNAVAQLATNILPYSLVYASELLVSIGRIQEFLREEEQEIKPRDATKQPHVHLSSVTTHWAGQGDEGLRGINLKLSPGEFICVIGAVGSGKSTLLHTILRETEITSGKMDVEGTVAFASQIPSIFPGTVRENILFGSPFKSDWYDAVVKACALDRDFELLPFYDASLVGDKGVTLSGGQKARISLARAIYRNADIYLLDDPLSSVDVTTGRHINNSIKTLLKAKCVILVTHLTRYAYGADKVIVLDKGTILASGTAEDLAAHGHVSVDVEDAVDDIANKTDATQNKLCTDTLKGPNAAVDTKGNGIMGIGVLWQYMRVGNSLSLVWLTIILFVINQIVLSGSDVYLKSWVHQEEQIRKGKVFADRDTYVTNYTLLMIPVIIAPFVCSIIYFWTSNRTIVQLHKDLLRAVIYAQMRFFETTQTGWILNRFSKDMTAADQLIPDNLRTVCRLLLQGFGALAVVSLMSPPMTIPSVLLFTAFFLIRNFYLRAASGISRLETSSKSSVLSCVSVSIHGLSTIRAFKMERQFITQFDQLQNVHSSACFAQYAVTRWLGIMTQLFTVFYFAIVATFYITTHADASVVGLAVATAISMSPMLAMLLRQSTDLESRLVAVDRILEYSKLPSESQAGYRISRHLPSEDWPSSGGIQFTQATAEYIKGQPVLSDITCQIQPCEKIGIVGRTGAGKTTLVSTIFRIMELSSGSIHIDGIDISKLSIFNVRSRLTIIPQEPILFKGTLRKNLDPRGEYDDVKMYQALASATLIDRVARDGLETEVAENGSNFSHGQRQLISIARAMLRNPKILVMDESTAHLDSRTDEIIRSLVKTNFEHATVITIAHRLQTVLDSDRICVMAAGKILEFDTIQNLLRDDQGEFSQLMRKGNLKLE